MKIYKSGLWGFWRVPKTTPQFQKLARKDSQVAEYGCTNGWEVLQYEDAKHIQRKSHMWWVQDQQQVSKSSASETRQMCWILLAEPHMCSVFYQGTSLDTAAGDFTGCWSHRHLPANVPTFQTPEEKQEVNRSHVHQQFKHAESLFTVPELVGSHLKVKFTDTSKEPTW